VSRLAGTDAPRRIAFALLVVATLAGAWLGLAGSSRAALICSTTPISYDVAWGNDEADGGSAGAGADGKLSLEEAIGQATADHHASIINLPAGDYFLSDGQPIGNDCPITIQGAGARVTTIHGPAHDHVFMNGGPDLATINGVTITGAHSNAGGGAILNDGKIALTNVAIVANAAEYGGGVANTVNGDLTISASTFSGNSAASGIEPTSQGGGAIYNSGAAKIFNSTISGNTAGQNNTAGGLGGGIYTQSTKTTYLYFVTLDHNQATGTSTPHGGNLGGDGEVFISSSVFARGVPDNCANYASAPSSGDKSIADDASCGTTQADPKLGPLQNNGGPTDTQMLLPGSAAKDTGEIDQCSGTLFSPPFPITVDQRGIARPQGSGCDLGAYELVQNADLGVTAAAAPNPVTVGQNVTFAFTIASSGPANDGVYPALTDVLPSSLQFVSASAGCSAAAQTVTCTPGPLANGFSVPVTIVAQANALGPVSNSATVSSPRPDTNAANDSATAGTVVQSIGTPGTPKQILDRLLLSNTTFRALGSGGPIAAARKRAPLGTTVGYTLSQPATVAFTVQSRKQGHRKGRRCVLGKPRRIRGKKTPKKCTVFRRAGKSFTRQSPAGTNSFKFTGRPGAKKLKPGPYRLVGVATNAAGKKFPPLHADFTIVK
jgi:uncharacterized repeat protein (TIGR01451 family)